MYKIEKNIPIGYANKPMYPFDKMEVGDSFFVKGDKKKANSVGVAVSGYKKRTPGVYFTCRVSNEGIRVWRIK
jgi:hypothetical protein